MTQTNFLKNVFLNLSTHIAPALIGVVTLPFVVRTLGPEASGVFSLAYTLQVGLTLFDFGMSRATTYAVSTFLGQQKVEILSKMVWTSLWIHLGLGIVGGGLFALSVPMWVDDILVMSPSVREVAKSVFLCVAMSIPFVLSQNAMRGVLEAAGRFDYISRIRMFLNSLIFALPAALLFFGFGLFSIAFVLFLVQGFACLSYFFLMRQAFSWFKMTPSFQGSSISNFLSYGGWVTVSALIGPVLVYLDRFFLGNLVSVSEVAFYVIPYEAVTRLSILPASLTLVLFPAFTSLSVSGQHEALSRAYGRSIRYLLLAMGPIIPVIVIFADPFLRFFLGESFATYSTRPLQILAIGVLVNSLAWIPFAHLQGIGRPDLTAKLHLIELLPHIVLVWLFVKNMGATGAALAWTLRVTVDMVLLYFFSVREPKLFQAVIEPKMGGACVILFGFFMATFLIQVSFVSLAVQGMMMAFSILIYVLFTWHRLIDPPDREVVWSVVKNFSGMRKKDVSPRSE